MAGVPCCLRCLSASPIVFRGELVRPRGIAASAASCRRGRRPRPGATTTAIEWCCCRGRHCKAAASVGTSAASIVVVALGLSSGNSHWTLTIIIFYRQLICMDSGSRLSKIFQLIGFSAPEKVFAEMVRCDCLPRFWQQHHVNSLSFGKPQFIEISGLPFKPSRSRSAGFGQSTCRSHSYLSSQVAEAGELGLEQ